MGSQLFLMRLDTSNYLETLAAKLPENELVGEWRGFPLLKFSRSMISAGASVSNYASNTVNRPCEYGLVACLC
jgi:hypothetical protein